MEKLKERFLIVKKALQFQEKAIADYKKEKNPEILEHIRNSKIQSFEFCVDTLWKFLRLYFKQVSGIDLEPAPKKVFQHCLKAGLTSEDQTRRLLNMVDDRNLSSHTYHEELAEELNEKIDDYFPLMQKIVERLDDKIK